MMPKKLIKNTAAMFYSIKTINTIFFLIIFSTKLFSQVSGVVLNSENEPIIGASVVWKGTLNGVITDELGNFSIKMTEATDTLEISFISYQSEYVKVADGNDNIRVVLSQGRVLEGVEIVQNRKGTVNDRNSVIQVQKITSEELKRAACCNLSESFETNPSVDVAYSDAATGAKQIRLLGLSGTYVQLMTENIPNLKGIASPYGLGYIPGPWMESIQISKGTGSVINGYESVTGQINVEYKKPPTADKLSLNLFVSEAGRVEANADAAFKINCNLSTGLLLHASDEFFKQDRNKDGFLDMPMIRQFNGINRWYYTKGGFMSQLFLHGLYEKRTGGQINGDYRISVETQRYEFFLKNGYIFNEKKQQTIGWILSGNWQKLDSQYGNETKENLKNHVEAGQSNDTMYFKQYKGKELSLYSNLIFNTLFAKYHKISTGWSVNYDRLSELFPLNSNNSGDYIFLPKNEFVTGIFAEYTYNLHEKFVFLTGLRYDYNAFFNKFLFTPRLHIKYAPIEAIHLRATIGKGYRSANIFAENNYLLASSRHWQINNNKNSYNQAYFESAWNGGISAHFFIPIKKKELQIIAEYFYTQFQNQTVIDLDQNVHEVNIYALNGKSYSHSFQIEANMEPFKGFTFTIAHRITDVKQTINGKLREKPFTNRWKSLLTLSYYTKFKKWQFDYTLQANGGGRLADPNLVNPLWDKEFKPFVIMNAQITKNFKTWSIYLGCENILDFVQKNPLIDVKNPYSNDFDATMIWGPTHGRKIYAGFRWKM